MKLEHLKKLVKHQVKILNKAKVFYLKLIGKKKLLKLCNNKINNFKKNIKIFKSKRIFNKYFRIWFKKIVLN